MHVISRNGDYIVPSIQRAFGISVTRFHSIVLNGLLQDMI